MSWAGTHRDRSAGAQPALGPNTRQTLALSGCVLAAHLWVLAAGPVTVQPRDGRSGKVATGSFTMRTIEGAAQNEGKPLAKAQIGIGDKPAAKSGPSGQSAEVVTTNLPKRAETPAFEGTSAFEGENRPFVQYPRPSLATTTVANESVSGPITHPAGTVGGDAPASALDSALPPNAAKPSPRPDGQAVTASTASSQAALPPASSLGARLVVPNAAILSYQVTGSARGNNYTAASQLQWQHDGANYQARLEIKAFLLGSRVQTSAGQLNAGGLSPARFGDKNRSERAAHFEADKGQLSFSNNRPPMPLASGMQDRLSVLLQLSALLAGDPERFATGSAISLPIASADDAETWVFTVDGPELLDLPGASALGLARVPSTKLTRNPRREFDAKVEVWLAPAVQWLPARVRITQANGDFVDQQLKSNTVP